MVIKQEAQVSNVYLLINLILFVAAVNFETDMNTKKFLSVDFEVYGIVQGVFFRKYTQQEANKLNLKGWCRNTDKGTVQGSVQGELAKINEMKHWLQYTGSPSSRIDRAIFTNEREIQKLESNKFDIRR